VIGRTAEPNQKTQDLLLLPAADPGFVFWMVLQFCINAGV
jgi:hypothetical protein